MSIGIFISNRIYSLLDTFAGLYNSVYKLDFLTTSHFQKQILNANLMYGFPNKNLWFVGVEQTILHSHLQVYEINTDNFV